MPHFSFGSMKQRRLATRGTAGAEFKILHVSKQNVTLKCTSAIPRLRNNYFLCRAEKEQGGTTVGIDAVLEVLAASTTGRKYAVMLRMR